MRSAPAGKGWPFRWPALTRGGACPALVASDDADIGMIAYEMNLMVKKVGRYLVAKPRVPGSSM
jgi:hypothetical protein